MTNYGSVEGMLTINKFYRLVIYRTLDDQAIECSFNIRYLDKAVNLLGKQVYAYGLLTYLDKELVSIEIDEIELLQDE